MSAVRIGLAVMFLGMAIGSCGGAMKRAATNTPRYQGLTQGVSSVGGLTETFTGSLLAHA